MSLFAIQTIWKQTQYYGCCNQNGFPALMRLWETLPKTRGFTLSQEIVHLLGQIPLKQKSQLLLKHRCNKLPQMNLPVRQNAHLKNLYSQLIFERKPSKRQFLSLAASCTYRSFCNWIYLLLTAFDTAVPLCGTECHRQGVSFKHTLK